MPRSRQSGGRVQPRSASGRGTCRLTAPCARTVDERSDNYYYMYIRGYYRHISKIFVSSVFRMPRFTGMTMHDLSPDPAPSRIEKDYRMIDSDCCADLESSMQCTCTCTAVLESTKFPCMPGLRRERSIKPFKPRSQAAAHKQQNVSIDTLMG